MLSMLGNLKVKWSVFLAIYLSILSFTVIVAGVHKLLRQKVVYVSLTISMSLEHLHKDPIGCQLMKHTSQELMSYTSGSTWQVYIGLTLPWIACIESHSATL
jgi:hypothetical protein